ncbi:glucokinase [Luteimonas aestuarii]|uniref:glucokinase n=1 Tax=Luteimonas aestuarii TaxID=453837 RepID=UPI001FB79AC4|nr:glucokinase [Luteimonas aestuarii]
MPASPLSLPDTASARAARPFVAADVGGTHVRIGLVRRGEGEGIEVLHYRKYACADYAGLDAVVADFLATAPAPSPVRRGVIACAGHALPDGSLLTVNLPWPVSLPALRDALGFEDFRSVNDFEAVAHAVGRTGAQPLLHLSGPATPPPGPSLVVGPGTGLGAAVRIPSARGAVVLPTEAGQAALTVGNALEMAVLGEFLKDRSHVPIEHALSGPGLVRLHHALAAVRGVAPGHATPDALSAAAQSGNDPLARETLDLFCGLLGSAIGDMALLYGAHGGVYLAGGVLPQIQGFLSQSGFVERFLDKGPMREALEAIPVHLVEHGQLGVIGAAGWYLDPSHDVH